jgi:hypothetical protein
MRKRFTCRSCGRRVWMRCVVGTKYVRGRVRRVFLVQCPKCLKQGDEPLDSKLYKLDSK